MSAHGVQLVRASGPANVPTLAPSRTSALALASHATRSMRAPMIPHHALMRCGGASRRGPGLHADVVVLARQLALRHRPVVVPAWSLMGEEGLQEPREN